MTGCCWVFPDSLLRCYMVAASCQAVDLLSVIDLDFPISRRDGNYLISSPDNV